MDSADPSPEEQLLRLIETGGTAPAAAPAGPWRPFDLQWWKHWWAQLRQDFKGPAAVSATPRWSFTTVNLKRVNQALAGLLVLIVLYMLWDMASPKRGVKDVYAQAAALPPAPLARETVTPLEPLEQYTAVLAKRDLFRLGQPPVTATEPAAPAPPVNPAKATLEAALPSLRIVGIAWSDAPEVMIEDTQAGRTYFLKRGQTVKQLTVEQIFRDKVVFSYEGEQGELVAP